MSSKLAVILFTPLIIIVPMVVWFSQGYSASEAEREYGIVAILENALELLSQAYNAKEFERLTFRVETTETWLFRLHYQNRFIPGTYVVAFAFWYLQGLDNGIRRDYCRPIRQFYRFRPG